MGWNHRVLLEKLDNAFAIDMDDQYSLQIHEVFYDKEGIPNGYTANSITINGDDLHSISWTVRRISDCLKKPILWKGEKFPQEVKVTYECLLCGRNKFTRKSPHYCGSNFRKRNIKWKINYE